MPNSPDHHFVTIDYLVARDRHPEEAQEILEAFYDKLDDHGHPHVPAEYLRWSYEMHITEGENADGEKEDVISRFGLRVACGDTYANQMFFTKRFLLSEKEDELPEEVLDWIERSAQPSTPENTPHICMIEAPYSHGDEPIRFMVLAGLTYPKDTIGLLVTPVARRAREQVLGVYSPSQHAVNPVYQDNQAFYGKLQRAEDGAVVRDGKWRHTRLTEDEVRKIAHGITVTADDADELEAGPAARTM